MISVAALIDDPNHRVGLVAILALAVVAGVRLLKQLQRPPARPDPWSDEIAAAVATEDCPPICHRCLTPHNLEVYFCPECGAPVGTYTNWLPFPYLFSLGHTLRIGTSDTFKRSPLVIGGFFILSLAE